jgi:hypothetical protein
MEKHSRDYCFSPNILEIRQKGCFDDFDEGNTNMGHMGRNLGHIAKVRNNLANTLGAIAFV